MSIVNKLVKSRGTIIKMLETRGIDTSDYNPITDKEVNILFNSMPKLSKDKSPLDIVIGNNPQVYIKYSLGSRQRVSNIISFVEDIIEDLNENDTLIIVIKDKLTTDTQLEAHFKTVYESKKIFVQYFYLDTLTFSIIDHELVPKHEKLSESERDTLIKNLNIKSLSQLPIIYKTDPVAKYIGLKENDVCKITRPSETTGIYETYRLCQ